MQKGYFITLEGVEGAGKSTAMQFIKEYLEAKQIDFVLTREPGGTEIAEDIREIILQHYQEPMQPYTELLLFFASRAQHITQVIQPALAANSWVISDRFTDASFAYQGIGRGIPKEHIAALENWIQHDLRPDLTLVLDVDAKIGLDRIKKAGDLDRMESEKIDFFQQVREYYLQRAKQNPTRYKIINAEQSLADVKQQLHNILANYA